MLSDPNVQSLLAGALFGGFFAFAVSFVRILVQLLTGLALVALVFFCYKQGLAGLEFFLYSIIESLYLHIYFVIGFVFGLIFIKLLGYLLQIR